MHTACSSRLYGRRYTVGSIPYAVISLQYTVFIMLQYTVHKIPYAVCIIHYTQNTVYRTQYTSYSIQCAVYSTQYTVYSIQSTVYGMRCAVRYKVRARHAMCKFLGQGDRGSGDIFWFLMLEACLSQASPLCKPKHDQQVAGFESKIYAFV